ncbi:aminotransferase class III-fold pyridoxal phosphate-dependent enzyme [Verrucomicrobia bacterium]|nr:aminotransferase class III-fold pyridoxal phosphate-dependent enzyme [Verrucomicrobiota bacterium]
MRVAAIVQARMGSLRLPDKVLKPIGGIPMIEILLSRLAKAKEIDTVIVATSIDPRNISLSEHVQSLGFTCEKGSENDVLDRYVKVAEKHSIDVVVRITGDCPLIDPELVDECVRQFKKEPVDYFSNINPPTFPDGMDIEVIKLSALQRAQRETKKPYDREHVTPYIRDSVKFTQGVFLNHEDLSNLRWTVDSEEDFEVISKVFNHFSTTKHFGWKELLRLQRSQPELFNANKTIKRNQGSMLGAGQKLWKRARQIIPGGNMLLSKRPEMFLPEHWPSYYSKAKGCEIWDLEGCKYIDMSIMGVGTNILGYAHTEVDDEVIKTVKMGNMSTLNCPEEVLLAEKLIELHPWADMVRFARTGGEANAIATRIARAASGRDKVAICGYHGWHDWYLSANLGDKRALDGHLLPGLTPNGVPRNLKSTALPFNYNSFDELESLVRNHEVGAIMMEVVRNTEPEDCFLEKVRNLATQKNIILIFDECTSGFRETFGGIHKKYNVEPDMAIFGKALGNGYAITSILGKSSIMEYAQNSFISSTFWTERIGPTAALKTLEVMDRENSWETISKIGLGIREGWKKIAKEHQLDIYCWGIQALPGFTFKCSNSLKYKTLITQEMLKKGFLAANCIYVSTAHKREIIEEYFEAINSIFRIIKDCEEGANIEKFLDGPESHKSFSRLN